ncbi:hypothetical protein K3495_g2902 [Podosphaera aphanis]|nr:hypothetical protein K3495_g2902 [Podosphaera aphanis]
MNNDKFATGAGPKPPNIYLDDDNFREFFRNQELWLKARGWLYVFRQSEYAANPDHKTHLLDEEKQEKFDQHDASAQYYTRQLIHTIDREPVRNETLPSWYVSEQVMKQRRQDVGKRDILACRT